LKGDTSGRTVTATPAATVTGKTQTVSAGSLTVTPASSLVSQNIIDGSNAVVLGRYVLDASSSGEDAKVTTVQIRGITGTNADLDEVNSLQLFDVTNGSNRALTTGSNINNPSGNTGAADANLSFTMDSNALTVAKGGQMIVELRGNVNASSTPTATTQFTFDFSAGSPDWTVTGANTGKSITETLNTTAGATLTIVGAGTLTASLDTSSPLETWYTSGDEATIGVLKFLAVNEDMAVTDLGLSITTASSSAADFTSISLYKGTTLLKTLTNPAFTSDTQTFTFGTSDFVVPKGDDGAKMTIKAKFANIGTGYPGTAGHLVRIATSTTATQNKATGVSSGSSVNILGSASNSTGARYFKSLPIISAGSLTTGEQVLGNGTKNVYRFSVKADEAGDIELYKFNFTVATTTMDANSWKLVDETGAVVRSAVASAGATGATTVTITPNSSEYGATVITVPAGTTKTFVLSAVLSNVGAAGDSITVQLDGDAAYDSLATLFGAGASTVAADTNGDFVWSDRSDSSHTISTNDWFNGYKVPGLPTTNLDATAISY